MKYKVYNAVDKVGFKNRIFTVREDGKVNVSTKFWDDNKELKTINKCCEDLFYDKPKRFNDAIDPILIGEFEV